MPRELKSFTDHNGKRGKVGDLVHSLHIDGASIERRRAEAREVIGIWSGGARGAVLKLKGEHMAEVAKQCTIFKEE